MSNEAVGREIVGSNPVDPQAITAVVVAAIPRQVVDGVATEVRRHVLSPISSDVVRINATQWGCCIVGRAFRAWTPNELERQIASLGLAGGTVRVYQVADPGLFASLMNAGIDYLDMLRGGVEQARTNVAAGGQLVRNVANAQAEFARAVGSAASAYGGALRFFSDLPDVVKIALIGTVAIGGAVLLVRYRAPIAKVLAV